MDKNLQRRLDALDREFRMAPFPKRGSVQIEKRNDGSRELVGLGVVYESLSVDLGGWREIIERGAGKKTALEADARAFFNHNPDMILGRTRADTLSLTEDSHGLWYSIQLGSQSYARDVEESVERGDVSGSSFMFDVVKREWDDDQETRRVKEFRLHEVGPVVWPAYQATSATVRGLALQIDLLKRFGDLSEEQCRLLDQPLTELRALMHSRKSEPGKPHSGGEPARRHSAEAEALILAAKSHAAKVRRM